MNPIFEARGKQPYVLGKNEISTTTLDKGYQWLVAQTLTHEVYADGISFTFRFEPALEFLYNRFRKSPYVVIRPEHEVKKGQDRTQYVLPQEIIAGLILRFGFDVVQTLYNTKKIDIASESSST